MNKHILTILTLFFTGTLRVDGQEVEVKATLNQDSVKIGEWIHLSLTSISDGDDQLLYPTKEADFTPFELVEKHAFPTTRLDSSRVKDSAVYTLRTFEMKKPLEIQLPVYSITKEGDSIKHFHEPLQLPLKKVITGPPEKIEVKTTVDFLSIPKEINWPFWIILSGVIVLILGIILFFTFKPIMKYWNVRKLTKKHELFLQNFDQELISIVQEDKQVKPEEWIQHWKDHVAYLSKKPLNSYTTKDFNLKYKNEALLDTLTAVDALVYGGRQASEIKAKATTLVDFSNELFNERIAKLKHGK